MPEFQLSQREAINWAGDQEWKKGQSYVRGLTGLTRQPDGERLALQGSAHGQEKYSVRVTLQKSGVQKAHCSCPVGAGGYCKHVAALLARAVKAPEDFTELSDLGNVLDSMNADDLRGLVRLMLEREPDLMRLVLTRPARSTGQGGEKSHLLDLRQRIEDALSLVDYDPEEDWEGEGIDLSDFDPLIGELEEQLARAGELDLRAQGELLAACLALLSGAEDVQNDDYGVEADTLIAPARTGLLQLLHYPLDGNLREMALEGLQDSIAELDWSRYEIDTHGQFELFAALPDEERHRLQDFVRGLIPQTKESYFKRRLTELLFVLMAEEKLDFGEELELARATGNQIDLIEVLFKHEKVEEAISELSRHRERPAPQQVEAYFKERDLLPRLEEYARQNLKVFGSRAWLFQRYRETGRQAEAYALAREAVFKETGEHVYYTSFFLTSDLNWLEQLKATSSDWSADREAYIQHIWKKPHATDHLMLFLLEEGLLDRAEELVNRRGVQAEVNPQLLQQLALKLPAERAKPLFLKAAARYVAGGERKSYRMAAETLLEAVPLIGLEEARAIAKLLLQENPRLRALPDELKQAGLT